jgi:hypothetical protein
LTESFFFLADIKDFLCLLVIPAFKLPSVDAPNSFFMQYLQKLTDSSSVEKYDAAEC